MTLLTAAEVAATLRCSKAAVYALARSRAIDHLRGREPEPEPWEEPDELPAPDVYLITLARDDPRVGMYSRN